MMIVVHEIRGRKVFEQIAENRYYGNDVMVGVYTIGARELFVAISKSGIESPSLIQCSIDGAGFLVEGDFPSIYFCNIKDLNDFIDRIVQKYLES